MKPKVLICGQKPRRHVELEKEFGDRARLTFFYKGNLHQLRDQARGAHRIFICVDAANHATTRTCRDNAPGRVVILGGATTNLKEAIAAWLASPEAASC